MNKAQGTQKGVSKKDRETQPGRRADQHDEPDRQGMESGVDDEQPRHHEEDEDRR